MMTGLVRAPRGPSRRDCSARDDCGRQAVKTVLKPRATALKHGLGCQASAARPLRGAWSSINGVVTSNGDLQGRLRRGRLES